ncbi:MAG: selenium cofactor biosynthesis protein YqeC [Christensenella sp.]|nr:selenium cofactor biosynthesis protein YqeC [Christensenella sp.]
MQTILLSKTDRAADALAVPRGITSIVGGGGKTTLLLRLARELRETGARVVVTTSTHIFPPEGIPTQTGGTLAEVSALLNREDVVCLGTPVEEGKLATPKFAFAELAKIADYVLVEADGAKGFPLKAPAEHEPVIPAETSLVVAVAGLDGLGKPISETVFRPALYAALLGTDEQHMLGPADLARVLTHPLGQRKAALPGMRFGIVLNKADSEADKRDALEVALKLDQNLAERVVIASLGQTER